MLSMVPVFVLMLMAMPALVPMLMPVVMMMMSRLILVVRVRRALVDAELHTFDLLPLGAVEVHMEVADLQLGQFPFQSGGFHTEVAQCADHHVAADSGEAVEKKSFHGNGSIYLKFRNGTPQRRAATSRRFTAPS